MKTFVVRTVSAAMLAGAMLATGACATQGAGAPGHQSQVDTDLGSASPAHPARTGPLDPQDTAGSKYFPKPATTYERWGFARHGSLVRGGSRPGGYGSRQHSRVAAGEARPNPWRPSGSRRKEMK
jgi:hypothetical protein